MVGPSPVALKRNWREGLNYCPWVNFWRNEVNLRKPGTRQQDTSDESSLRWSEVVPEMLQQRSLAIPLAIFALSGCGTNFKNTHLITSAAVPARPAAKVTAETRAVSSKNATVTRVESPAAKETKLPPVTDEVIVKFRSASRDLPGATRVRDLGLKGAAIYKMNAGAYSLQSTDEWEEAEDIDYIEPNYRYEAVNTPNDANYAASWGVAAINAPSLWALTTGVGVNVAVLDTGVDARHPDLSGRVLPGIDLVNNDSDATDDHGHGTHVAGTIAAIANNGIDVAGIAPGASIIPIKVLNSRGQGSNADIASGILEAANRGAKIINLSLGGTDNSETIRRAIANVQERGVVVIAAAGNSGVSTPFFPAANEGVIGVAAVDSRREKPRFSNFGDYIDIAAPGVDIGSTKLGGGVTKMSGTSMASPHVAGACALILSQFPTLKTGHLTRLMQKSGHPTSGFPGQAPRALNVEEAFVQVPTLDMQAPSTVLGLTATPGAPGEVNLGWTAATDNQSRVSYRILRNGQTVGSTRNVTFTDRGVSGRSTYQIIAMDEDGNEAAPSAPVEGTPGVASDKIIDLRITKRSTQEVTISWKTTEPMRCLVQWGPNASLGEGTTWATTPTKAHSVTLKKLSRFKTYHYRVVAATNSSTLHYSNTQRVRTKLWFLFSLPE